MKRYCKKLLALVLSVVLLCSMLPAAYAQQDGSYRDIEGIETFVNGFSQTHVTVALELSVNRDALLAAPSQVTFTDLGNGRYQAEVHGLSPDTSCIFHLVNAPDNWNRGEFQDATADDDGIARFVFGGSQTMDLLQNGYYLVLEQTYNHISGNGTVCETRFAYRGYAVKCDVTP